MWELDPAQWVAATLVLAVLIYLLATRNHGYFAKQGLSFIKPLPFFGSLAPSVFRLKSIAYIIEDLYKASRDRIIGSFDFNNPVLIVRDPEIIKSITIKDFDHFVDHSEQISADADPLLEKNLFSLRGQEWRDMRATLSPAFTSSKMKNMFHLMNDCGLQLGNYLEKQISEQPEGKTYAVEMKGLFTRYTNDVIATSAFGVHIDTFSVPNNEFYVMGKDITNVYGVKNLIFLGYMMSPALMKFLNISLFSKKVGNFFRSLVLDTISTREKLGIVRPDMIHLLMQARRGELSYETGEEDMLTGRKKRLTDDDIIAQAVVFFFAGFDSTASLLSFASNLIAVHEDVQRRLQEEIDDALADGGKITYEKLQSMKYIDMVLSETLRLYPVAPFLDRKCVRDYVIPASDSQPAYIVKKGDVLRIPIYGMHRDPQYFSEPEQFLPGRFSDENKQDIKPFTYLPFGSGPRLCIGQRFALTETKMALVHILSKFNLTVIDKTPVPIKLTGKGFTMDVDGGFWLGITPRKI